MRIDGFTSASEIVPEQSAHQVSTKPGAGATVRESDRTTLSADSVSISSLTTKAMDNPAVRQARVDSLREAVRSGQYQIEPSKIAAFMVNESA